MNETDRKAAAMIVVYHADPERLRENFRAISGQVSDMIIVVNGKDSETGAREALAPYKAHYIINETNEGIARALNQGIAFAEELGYEWILTLDQDSVASDGMVESLSRYCSVEKVGLIGPEKQDRNKDNSKDAKHGWAYDNRMITSGSLHSIPAWKDAGKYTEELFIDYVDYDFNAKLILAGYTIIRDYEAVLLHEVGKIRMVNVFGMQAEVLNHQPMRYYYYARNLRYYYLMYPDIADVKLQKTQLRYRFIKTVLFEKHKIKKVKAMLKGLMDAVKLVRDIRGTKQAAGQ